MPLPTPSVTRERRRRSLPALAVVLFAALLLPLGIASPALAATLGTVLELKISVTNDGTEPTKLDGSNSNGLTATNSAVIMQWAISATNLVDGTFTQTLPEGWRWDIPSLVPLTASNSLYSSSYVVEGGTLTATMSIPNSSLVNIIGIRAVPGPEVAKGATYQPAVSFTDSAQTREAASPTTITVVGEHSAWISTTAGNPTTARSYDFGSGVEAAYVIRAPITLNSDPTALGALAPMTLDSPVSASLTVGGRTPTAVDTSCVDAGISNAVSNVSLDRGANAVAFDLNGSGLKTGAQDAVSVAGYLCFWYPATEATESVVMVTWDGASAAPLTANGGQPTSGPSTFSGTGTLVVPQVKPPTLNPAQVTENLTAWTGTGEAPAPASFTKVGADQIVPSGAWLVPASTGRVSRGATMMNITSLTLPKYQQTGEVYPTGNIVGYDFWNPAIAQIHDRTGTVFVGYNGDAAPADDYTVSYTTGSTPDGPWYPSIAAAGGVSAVSGVRVAFTGAVSGASKALVSLGVTQTVVGQYNQSNSHNAQWTGDGMSLTPRVAGWAIVPVATTVALNATPAQITSGSDVKYSVPIQVGGVPGAAAGTVTNLTATLKLDSAVTNVDYSAAERSGWKVLSYTPGDYGPDGMAGTKDDVSGPVIVFTVPSVDVPAYPAMKTVLTPIQLTATTSLQAPMKNPGILAASVTIGIDEAPGAFGGATNSVRVTQSNGLTLQGAVKTPVIQPSAKVVEWSNNWYNFTNTATGDAYIMDVLPQLADGRGTSTTGTLTLVSAKLLGQAEASGGIIEFTMAPPATIGAVPGNAVTWAPFTSDTDLSSVTALRVYLPGLNQNASGGLQVVMSIDGQSGGDIMHNSGQATFVNPGTTLDSGNYSVRVEGSAVAGAVWEDQNADGIRDSTEPGISGATVALRQSSTEIRSVVTDSNGHYRFVALDAGDEYQVRVDPTTLGKGSATQTASKSSVLDHSFGPFALAGNGSEENVDFGYTVENPVLTLHKSGALAAGAAGSPGDTVNFEFVLTNEGNTLLEEIAVEDQLPGLSSVTFGAWPNAVAHTLTPGQSVTASASYRLTQTDIDAGAVTNSAMADARSPRGDRVASTDMTTVPLQQTPGLMLTKTGELAAGKRGVAGDIASYTFTATNTGNSTLTDVSIADPLPGIAVLTYGEWPSGTVGTLAPGESISASASYVITQDDTDAGFVLNTATASGKTPAGDTLSDDSSARLVLNARSSIDLVKSAQLEENAAGRSGDLVDYSFTVTNTGDTTLTGVVVTDDLPGLSQLSFGSWPRGNAGTLAPGESVVATASYALTQVDVDAGAVLNTASAHGSAPSSEVSDLDEATVQITQRPAISLIKSGKFGDGGLAAGGTVEFEFTATNSGNTSLTGVEIFDELEGLSPIDYGAWNTKIGVLAPGEQMTASASYELTQADIDSGAVINTATVEAQHGEKTACARADAVVNLMQFRTLDLQKTAVLESGGTPQPGDRIEYSFEATNYGNTSLTDVVVTDAMPGLSAVAYGAWPGAEGSLAPGEVVTAHASYAITQADIDAGTVQNTALVTGSGPGHEPVESEANATVELAQRPAIELEKEAELESGATGTAGDTISYSFVATNTGNTTLRDVAIGDPLAGLSAVEVARWESGEAGVLSPGQSVTGTATYVITTTDVTAGAVTNTAVVNALTPNDQPLEASSNTVVVPTTPADELPPTTKPEDTAKQDDQQDAPAPEPTQDTESAEKPAPNTDTVPPSKGRALATGQLARTGGEPDWSLALAATLLVLAASTWAGAAGLRQRKRRNV